MRRLARHLGKSRRDRGSSALEYLGFLPLLLLVGLAAVQLGIAVYVAQQASTGARAAARVVSQNQYAGVNQVGRAAMTGWVADRAEFGSPSWGDGTVTVTGEVEIPTILPGLSLGKVHKSATMPVDRP
ncbi:MULTISPECIES: TadE/TadG family type IV pilus assembly protein [unclassified Streptomyces]|uniref:TadE/TadG family type IV pilus assembly protein n=1 Tax=unclassified Streptomyces TaxID=2593676 RepID=UPI001D495149|nr:pilus assembly protein [Streptomyces sp. MAG02]